MAEIKQLFTPQEDSSSQTTDLIHISRTLNPKLKAAFGDKTEHSFEYEFGYYAELSKTKSVLEFKDKILSIVQGLGFSDFAFMRLHCGDIDSRLVLTTPADMLASYFGGGFMKYDMVVPYAEQKLDPVYCARRAGNLEIVEQVKNINDRLNHTRVCESQIERTPAVALLAIMQQGIEGNYEELQTLFEDPYNRSVILLPHLMRKRVSPMMGLAEETVANTFNVAGGQAPRQSAK